ncbi:MAG TPA: methyltransferase domain-containing protein [Acidimicrobiia bacterium]|nr:methyltransferase domain-containing protein [Acidimicrobiia bacterium]
MSDPEYALTQDDDEFQRLARQAAAVEPFTERVFRAAGIGHGMRVLDVGCGAGHVSMLVARLVGDSGEVVGIDREALVLEHARAQVRAAGLGNVSFVNDDFRTAELPGGAFDAVVGRYVLQYQADPQAAISVLARRLRSGGVMAFHEMDIPDDDRRRPAGPWPPSPLADALVDAIFAVWRATGTQLRMGVRLPSLYAAAGLRVDPLLHTQAMAGIGEGWATAIVSLLRSMEGVIREHGIADYDALDLDTAVERLLQDAPPPGPVGIGPLNIGAWATAP